jgi:hypothetical protein
LQQAPAAGQDDVGAIARRTAPRSARGVDSTFSRVAVAAGSALSTSIEPPGYAVRKRETITSSNASSPRLPKP